jgi:predicted Zn-dependent protease
VPLAGTYAHDDEGVPSQRVPLIQDGILKNFLMSRMPITNFAQSNGHGRRQAGFMPTGRQGNLIVQSSKTVRDSELRGKLIEEAKKAGKPYGLYFEDVQGGFTLTTRELPQAFQVLPVIGGVDLLLRAKRKAYNSSFSELRVELDAVISWALETARQ